MTDRSSLLRIAPFVVVLTIIMFMGMTYLQFPNSSRDIPVPISQRGGTTKTIRVSGKDVTSGADTDSGNKGASVTRFASTSHPKVYSAATGSDLGISSENMVKVVDSQFFPKLVDIAKNHPRKRKMNDLTRNPANNTLQSLMNTWTEGSYSPVHMHLEYAEAFVVLDGALAFFVFTADGTPTCHVLSATGVGGSKRAIIVEAGQYHAMTAASRDLGYPGHAVIFEMSGHKYDSSAATKALAPFSPVTNNGLDGDPVYFKKILATCAKAAK